MKLHASGEDYLETILVLQKKLGMVRSVDVARHMEVSKPSVCHAVATLWDGGFLTMRCGALNVCEKLFTKDSRRILRKKLKLLFVSRRTTALPKSRRFLSGLKRTVLRQTL